MFNGVEFAENLLGHRPNICENISIYFGSAFAKTSPWARDCILCFNKCLCVSLMKLVWQTVWKFFIFFVLSLTNKWMQVKGFIFVVLLLELRINWFEYSSTFHSLYGFVSRIIQLPSFVTHLTEIFDETLKSTNLSSSFFASIFEVVIFTACSLEFKNPQEKDSLIQLLEKYVGFYVSDVEQFLRSAASQNPANKWRIGFVWLLQFIMWNVPTIGLIYAEKLVVPFVERDMGTKKKEI